jgi:hypothetical protein
MRASSVEVLQHAKFSLFNQQQHDLNDMVCAMIQPLLKAIGDEPSHRLRSLWIDSGATDDVIAVVSRIKTLEELHVTNC